MPKPTLLLLALLAGRLAAAAQAAPPAEEYLLLGNASRGSGEPMLAVDPTNPRNVIVVGMGSLHKLSDAPVSRSMVDAYHATPNSTYTWLGVTHNGGRTWKVGELPILKDPKFTRCPDPFAAVTPQGTFLAGCEPRETAGDFFGGSYMVVSTDKGDTWGPPVPIVTSYARARFAPGLKPRIGGNSPWDRPFLRIDDSTGVIYGQGGGGQTDIDQKPGVYRLQSYLTASTDGGKSFGTIYAWDSLQYPQLGRGDFDAAHGVVAEVYEASKVPASQHATCPCVVFGLSHNQGQSFQYHVLPQVTPPPVRLGPPPELRGNFPGAGGPGGLRLVADQNHAGRFFLMQARLHRLQLSSTDDYGKTWSAWASTTPVPNTEIAKPWISESPQGVLGIMWRAISRDGSYEIWSVISRDGGQSFSAPLRVSHAPSPLRYPARDVGWFGDDVQDLVLDGHSTYMVWGDSRAGFLGTWYAHVPLADYH
ncbi:MAG TPA: sialidase family protein [Terriglobales bacterium]|nr:sialidase family protein [Terriglobales bacterium]